MTHIIKETAIEDQQQGKSKLQITDIEKVVKVNNKILERLKSLYL